MRNNPLSIVNNEVVDELMVHVRFEGRSYSLPMGTLDVGEGSSDEQIKNAVANNLDVPVTRLSGMMVERESNGNFTVRPEAVFG